MIGVCVCACVPSCVRARARVCVGVRACVRARTCVCVCLLLFVVAFYLSKCVTILV